MLNRRSALSLSVALVALLPLSGQASDLKELNFGIISTESTQNLKQNWTPFLADMEKATSMKVNAFFAPDYAGIIEGMRFNKVQVAWYGNASAIQAVDRANGEVFVQTVSEDGSKGYFSLLIVHKDSPLNSLNDLLAAPGRYTLANGDPNSTSGFLVPSYYAWAKNNVDIRSHFTRIVSGNHESNALAVVNRQADVATNNNENVDRLGQRQPEKRAELKEIWRSPLIPSDPIVRRADLPVAVKASVEKFFLGYARPAPGKSADDLAREKQTAKALQWSPEGAFDASSNRQLLPVRQLGLFRDRLKIEQDSKLSDAERREKLADIDARLAELNKQISGS